ncbi:YciI family protein [Micromonospora sp. 067-2]|uniref:YciI family protein n=1 Tax=Micromonospora sp. 067-2 TaxID=2789270 RepID=UPI00397B6779
MAEIGHFALKLVPPRPSFASDMTDAERAIMTQHVTYWRRLLDQGVAVVFGPIIDPSGPYGLGIIEAASLEEVHRMEAEDPAIATGLCAYQVFAMPGAVVRGDGGAI